MAVEIKVHSTVGAMRNAAAGVSFIRRKFNAMLGVATVTMSVNYIVMLSGSVVVGCAVGPDGLAGVNVCTPAFGIASFVASLISVGSGLVFSRAMGAFDDRRAGGIFTQSVTLAAACGLGVFAAMTLGGTAFLDFMGVTGEVRRQAADCWRWQSVAMGLTPLVLLMEAMVYADGDGLVAALAGVCHVSGSIGFSLLFTWLTGSAGGSAAGTALTMAVVLAVSSLHFLRRNNHLRFVRCWSKADVLQTIASSLPDATIYLCWGVLVMAVNKIVVVNFGEGLLAVVALAASVVEFSIVFDGVGEALIPLGGMYQGEGNVPALRSLARHSALVATAEGTLCGVIFFALAPVLAPLYGISASSGLLAAAVEAIRILAFAMPFMGFLMMANTHYLVIRHAKFAVSITVLKDFLFPCLFVILLQQSVRGVWFGFVLGYVLAAAYPFVFVRLRYGRRFFPWLLPADDGRILNFAVRLTQEGLAVARDRIGGYLAGHGVGDRMARRVVQTVEGTALATIGRNPAGKTIAEYAVFIGKGESVRLVTRDTGVAFDVTAHLSRQGSRETGRYLNTLNSNRAEFVFQSQSPAPANSVIG